MMTCLTACGKAPTSAEHSQKSAQRDSSSRQDRGRGVLTREEVAAILGSPVTSIEPDKVMFATGRVVGRVLKVERKGNNLDVTLGPVELTDVIKEAHIDYSGAIDPARMIVYVAPSGYPATFVDRDAPAPIAADTASATREFPGAADAQGQFAAMQTVYFDGPTNGREVGGCPRRPEYSARNLLHVSTLPTPGIVGDIAGILLNGFQIVPDVSKGLGATIRYPLTNGMQFVAHANLRLDAPKLTFRLDISGG